MDIALLNEKVVFQKNEVVTDDIGNHVNKWNDYYSCSTTVGGENGTESESAGQTVDHGEISFSIRWCRRAANISMTGYRVIFHDEIYDIVSIDHKNYRKRSLKFRCRKELRSG